MIRTWADTAKFKRLEQLFADGVKAGRPSASILLALMADERAEFAMSGDEKHFPKLMDAFDFAMTKPQSKHHMDKLYFLFGGITDDPIKKIFRHFQLQWEKRNISIEEILSKFENQSNLPSTGGLTERINERQKMVAEIAFWETVCGTENPFGHRSWASCLHNLQGWTDLRVKEHYYDCSSHYAEVIQRLELTDSLKTSQKVFHVEWVPCSLVESCFEQDVKSVSKLIDENDMDVNVCDTEGWRPIHVSIARVDSDLARLLLERGAEITDFPNGMDCIQVAKSHLSWLSHTDYQELAVQIVTLLESHSLSSRQNSAPRRKNGNI